MRGLLEYLREYAANQIDRYESKNGGTGHVCGYDNAEDWINSMENVELLERYEQMVDEREEQDAKEKEQSGE